jgi:hypothetical protein
MKKETSRIVFGAPHSFGWVHCPSVDAKGLQGWERPDEPDLLAGLDARAAE